MKISEDLLDRMIEQSESFNATSMAVTVGEYKGWKVSVQIERIPDRNKN